MSLIHGVGRFKSLTRVKFVMPPPAYPFACVFKEASSAEADPEAIMGIFIELENSEKYVVTATDDETLIFNVKGEAKGAEMERLRFKPTKIDVNKKGVVKEEWDKAWDCSCYLDPPKHLVSKLEGLLRHML